MPNSIRTRPAHCSLRWTGTLSLALLAASCGGETRRVTFRPETQNAQRFALYTLGESDGTLNCSLELERNPKEVFGFRLTKELNVVPMKLTVELLDSAPSNAKLSAGKMMPVLFLEDGTALPHWRTLDLVDEVSDKEAKELIKKAGFNYGLLQKEGNDSRSKLEGYLFFEAPQKTEGEMILEITHDQEATYAVDLRRSMLQFDYTRITKGDESVHTFNLGAQ